MRFRCACVALLCALAAAPAAAQGADVLVLGDDGRARAHEDPFTPPADPPALGAAAPVARSSRARRTVPGELRRMLAAGAIDRATHDADRARYDGAVALERRLSGTRAVELGAVRRTLDAIAASGALTVSRLPALMLTLDRNRRWWSAGPLLAPGRRIGFAGSELVWQYYPGQGLQLQMLATFGKLNGLWQGKTFDARLARLLDEVLALPAERAGGLAWESYFSFDGGRPPWVSGMTQGTAVQALARAAIRLGRKDEVLPIARRALRVFETAPPAGVRVAGRGGGAHYLLYSFAPRMRVINGFAQAVIGLHDFAGYANDPRARALYAAGERAARREVPTFDTGAWSLYSRGPGSHESDLGYHELLGGFLAGLCERTGQQAYCETRKRFLAYETRKPVVSVTSRRLRGGATGRLRFSLSKISRVGVEVARGGRVVFSRPAFAAGHGHRFVEWAVPRAAGDYRVRVTAVDLAGNVGSAQRTVRVLRPRT